MCLFIRMADRKRYWELNLKLSNTFVFGGDDYLKNLTEALTLLNNFKPSKKTGRNEKGTIEDEQGTGQHTGFSHVQAEVPRKNNSTTGQMLSVLRVETRGTSIGSAQTSPPR